MTEKGENESFHTFDDEAIDVIRTQQRTTVSSLHDKRRCKHGLLTQCLTPSFSSSLTLLSVLFMFAVCCVGAVPPEAIHDQSPSNPATSQSSGDTSESSVCKTPQCTSAAESILKDIDETMDPCNDFYAYTCNNWIKSHNIPEGKSSVGTFVLLSTENKQVLYDILKGDYKTVVKTQTDMSNDDMLADEQSFNKVKDMFDSCMDEAAIDALGAQPIYPLLKELRTLYPASSLEATEAGEFIESAPATITDSNTQKQQLTQTLVRLAQYGVNSLFGIEIDADRKDPAKIALYLEQAGLTLPTRQYYDQPDVVQTFHDTVAETMDIVFRGLGSEFGWNQWSAHAAAKQVIEFEKLLANISDLPEDLQDPGKIYNPRTLSEMTKASPGVDWDMYITHMKPVDAPHQDTVIVTSPAYLQKLSEQLLSKSTPRTIQLYLMWQLIKSYVEPLSKEVRMPIKKLNGKLRGTDPKQEKPRWEICVDGVNGAVGFLAGRYYALEKFTADTKQQADTFVESIKNVFVERLPQLSWIDKPTQKRAEEKVAQIVRKVGYPTGNPNTMSASSVAKYYVDLQMKKGDYFANYLNSSIWQVKQEWDQIGKPVDRQKWFMNPQEVNAYYNPSFNEIVFPAGILQNPFFGSGYPEYLNYGGIGTVVGHELTHGFDNSGRQFDGQGRMVEWWTNETAASFEKHAQCFVKQYSSFVVDDGEGGGIHVNGKMTLGEDIADNGGLSQSFVAWKQRYTNDPSFKDRNRLLPGLEHLSPEQLFFISFGRIWCDKATAQQAKRSVLTDEHAPAKWRVNGAVQNSKLFSEVFKCPSGSMMNPVDKCELW